jgi:very-short-patch-repair endonuclease
MMCGMDRKIAIIAEMQYGVFTAAQARAAGFNREAMRHRVASGRWERLAEGVYRLPGTRRTWEQRLCAATLAAGPCAAASHRSAAALLAIPGFDRRGAAEVTTPRTRRHRGPDTIVHRWRPFPDDHLTVIDGLVTTRAARTLVDLAGVVHPRRTERAVDNCLAEGSVTFDSLHATFLELAGRGRKGVAVMREILSERDADYVPPASELEALFRDLLRLAGLPDPVRQLDVGDALGWIGRVDFAYPRFGLLIELDGRRFHSALLDRRADAQRDQRLGGAGWREVVRLSWFDVVHQPELVVALLRRLMAEAAA